ncbi:polysaccharide lyase [Spirosoma sp. SC4-14]|uniref:polysaccharide lyase n=1 Tax=Spirosoma sp. SC4-14 TaxID=3128900 RepID=UPI0030D06C5D
MLTTFLYSLLSAGLGSCSQSDTIRPDESVASARETASLLITEGFEKSQLASSWHKELRADNAGSLDQKLARVGKQSMRFSWKPSQYDGTNNSCHSELASAFIDAKENERWYGFSVYLPSANNADDAEIANIVQWHAFPDPGYEGTVPPINMTLEANNKLTFSYRASNVPITKPLQHATSQKIMSLGTAQYDQWVDYVVHIKWDPTGTTGIVQVWQNGQLKIDEQNVSVGYPNSRNYWKFGLYCWSGKATHSERVAYFDEMRVGNANATYNAVRPGIDNNTAR